MIAKGDVFGRSQPLILHLLDIPPMESVLQGVVMELADCALPLLVQVIPTSDPNVAFKDVSAAFLVGAMPRKEGMERKDLLSANVKIFKVQGEAIDKFAKKDVKVLVVGNPANTNAFICSHYAPTIPRENFTAMTRLDQNRAQANIAAKVGVPVENVKNVIIWGNHSATQFPDAKHATVKVGNVEKSVYDAIGDENYLKSDFVTTIQKRGAAVIAARKMSSAMSAAKAATDHMHDWYVYIYSQKKLACLFSSLSNIQDFMKITTKIGFNLYFRWHGTEKGKWVSMGVVSDGSYNVPKDIVFSFPVTIENKQWKVVQGLSIDDFARSKFDITAAELLEEKEEATAICKL